LPELRDRKDVWMGKSAVELLNEKKTANKNRSVAIPKPAQLKERISQPVPVEAEKWKKVKKKQRYRMGEAIWHTKDIKNNW